MPLLDSLQSLGRIRGSQSSMRRRVTSKVRREQGYFSLLLCELAVGPSDASRNHGATMKLNKTLFAVAALLIAPAFVAAAAHVDLGIAVGTPPPPPPAAYVAGPVGVAPGPGYVWVDGYWNWVGGRWVWVPGAWILPPHGHRVWVAPALEFRWHGGRWR
jgi:hypothetical protein